MLVFPLKASFKWAFFQLFLSISLFVSLISRLSLSLALSISLSPSPSPSESRDELKNISETASEQKRRQTLFATVYLIDCGINSFICIRLVNLNRITHRRHNHPQPQKKVLVFSTFFSVVSLSSEHIVDTWIALVWKKIGLGFVVTRRCASISNLEFSAIGARCRVNSIRFDCSVPQCQFIEK